MRFFWSLVLTGGLLLIGYDVFESPRERMRPEATSSPTILRAEDGTPLPPPPPPPR